MYNHRFIWAGSNATGTVLYVRSDHRIYFSEHSRKHGTHNVVERYYVVEGDARQHARALQAENRNGFWRRIFGWNTPKPVEPPVTKFIDISDSSNQALDTLKNLSVRERDIVLDRGYSALEVFSVIVHQRAVAQKSETEIRRREIRALLAEKEADA